MGASKSTLTEQSGLDWPVDSPPPVPDVPFPFEDVVDDVQNLIFEEFLPLDAQFFLSTVNRKLFSKRKRYRSIYLQMAISKRIGSLGAASLFVEATKNFPWAVIDDVCIQSALKNAQLKFILLNYKFDNNRADMLVFNRIASESSSVFLGPGSFSECLGKSGNMAHVDYFRSKYTLHRLVLKQFVLNGAFKKGRVDFIAKFPKNWSPNEEELSEAMYYAVLGGRIEVLKSDDLGFPNKERKLIAIWNKLATLVPRSMDLSFPFTPKIIPRVRKVLAFLEPHKDLAPKYFTESLIKEVPNLGIEDRHRFSPEVLEFLSLFFEAGIGLPWNQVGRAVVDLEDSEAAEFSLSKFLKTYNDFENRKGLDSDSINYALIYLAILRRAGPNTLHHLEALEGIPVDMSHPEIAEMFTNLIEEIVNVKLRESVRSWVQIHKVAATVVTDEDLHRALQNNICTYSVTKNTFTKQNTFECYTCGLRDGKGICESCRAVCHAGHEVSNIRRDILFYCDCGLSRFCKCCPQDA